MYAPPFEAMFHIIPVRPLLPFLPKPEAIWLPYTVYLFLGIVATPWPKHVAIGHKIVAGIGSVPEPLRELSYQGMLHSQ